MYDLIDSFLESAKHYDKDIFPFIANKKDFCEGEDSVYYSGPYWDEQEAKELIYSVLKGKWLSSGEQVANFEKQFSSKFNFKYSLMVNSGSSANLVMLHALKKFFEWNDDDEIIVCVCGFPTTVAPIIQSGLKPVFVDISWNDLNWNINTLESLITPRTRALFSSPVLGNTYDLDYVVDLCEKHKLKLISDNCDSLGSKWKDKYLTEYSIASSCSFYPAHHICTIEGGMVSSNIKEIVDISRSFAWWGRDCYCVGQQNLLYKGVCGKRFDHWLPLYDGPVDHKYVFSNMGYNLKPLDLQGSVGSIQLKKFSEIHFKRRTNKLHIQEILSSYEGVEVIKELPNAETSWFGVPVICKSKKLKTAFVEYLESNKIQTRNYFAGNILLQPGYLHLGDYSKYPEANQVLDRVFFLGCSPTINSVMINYIKKIVDRFFLDLHY